MKNKTLISDLRKQKGLTQEKLAELTGLNVRTIQRLESGEDASLETLRSIAVALDVEVIEWFCCKVFQKIYFSVKLRKKTERTE